MLNIRVIHRLHPYSPEWLVSRHERGEHIDRDDVIRIAEYDPTAVSNEIVCDYLIRAARGELKKKAGRRRTAGRALKLLYAEALVTDLARRLTARRERQRKKGIRKLRSGYSPTELALQVVANRLGYSSLEVLRNALSTWKSELNFRV